jgi:hypothetical protein
MPKTFPIKIEVEEIALGAVLRRLNDMPGIAKLHLDLGHGGQGSGKQELEQHAETKRDGGNKERTVVKLLMQGPKHISEISAALGGKKTRAYGVMTSLRKQGLSESAQGHGMHQLTDKAMVQLGNVTPALPAPEIKRVPSGRAAPGSGQIVLRAALDAGPVSPGSLRSHMAGKGMSSKSISGVLERAKRDGIIKKNGSGYELTAKGKNVELGAAHNG